MGILNHVGHFVFPREGTRASEAPIVGNIAGAKADEKKIRKRETEKGNAGDGIYGN
jgi:hypothetical protein